jgi:hypothetical protein
MRLKGISCRGGVRAAWCARAPSQALLINTEALQIGLGNTRREDARAHRSVTIRIVRVVVPLEIRPNGLICEKRFAIH